MKPRPLPEALLEMKYPTTGFRRQHEWLTKDDWAHFDRFLYASMDEVRLFHAERFAEGILRLIYFEDSIYFRHAVLRRELSGNIGYERQRDHAAHTVHNYLLGWFFLENSQIAKDEARRQFAARLGDRRSVEGYFSSFWPIASLLHDIGYLFEGSIEPMSFSRASQTAILGAEYSNDYFCHHFWRAMKLDTNALKTRACKLGTLTLPEIQGSSLVAIAHSLRSLASTRAIDSYLRTSGVDLPTLSDDAFRLWEQHYRSFKCDSMADRVTHLENAHSILLMDGLPSLAIRVLDHGICGALLQLQSSLLYYEIFCALPAHPTDPLDAEICERFKGPTDPPTEPDPLAFWAGIVWSTAAVAFHNIAQTKWPGARDPKELRISIKEDVLTFLGILVDILEEWDRYTMTRNSVFTGRTNLPIQGHEVALGIGNDGRVLIVYPTSKVRDKVREALDEALTDWSLVVEVRSLE